MTRILVDESPGETRVALIDDGGLAEFHHHRPAYPEAIGALYWARVVRLVPSMAGAFLRLPDTDGFLPDSDGAAGLTEGDHLAVRIVRAAQGGKGPRLTARLGASEQAAPGPVRLLAPGPTPLDELRAAFPAAPVESGPFPEAVETALEAALAPDAALAGGMVARFAATPALTAIDLDSAAATGGRTAGPAALMGLNRAALPGLVRQMALRNVSGAILIDFAGLPSRKRAALAEPLRAALAADRLGTSLAGFSHLGFAELQRPRFRAPLAETCAGPVAAAYAALRAASRAAAATGGARQALRAAPTVISVIEADKAARDAYLANSAYPLDLRADPSLPASAWRLETP